MIRCQTSDEPHLISVMRLEEMYDDDNGQAATVFQCLLTAS
jgi:hypothetical protein